MRCTSSDILSRDLSVRRISPYTMQDENVRPLSRGFSRHKTENVIPSSLRLVPSRHLFIPFRIGIWEGNFLPSFPWCTANLSIPIHKPQRGQKKRLGTSLLFPPFFPPQAYVSHESKQN